LTEKTPGKLTFVQSALRLTKTIFPLVGLAKANSRLTRAIASGAHHFQFLVEWGVDNPEYFDHYIDQFYAWKKSRNSLPWERGVYSSLAIQAMTTPERKPAVLELCSGDGFMAYHFYSLLAESVVAVDFDPSAIKFARRNSKAANIEYVHGDIRTDIPEGQFENIIWDQAIEHFTEAETEALMGTIASRLTPGGIFSGDTIVETHDGHKRLHQHEYEFHDKEDLARFLTPYFKHVQVFETTFPTRTNLYFYASNDKLPFDRDVSITLTKK
jgi:ubiquinone/menaquinone biosynthesis C-methylase UbiE